MQKSFIPRMVLLGLSCILAGLPGWHPFVVQAQGQWQNIQCACVGSKIPSKKDAFFIQTLFPQADKIVRIVFRDKTYYAVIEHRRIRFVLSGWETGLNSQTIWLVFNQDGQLIQVVRSPQRTFENLKTQSLNVTQDLSQVQTDYAEILILLQTDLKSGWADLIRKIRLNLRALDAKTQATP